MKVLGLTGGIGSGKPTVAGFFGELGVPVFIADTQAKKL
ncbi:dephospho-CoA kinase, partial [Salinimicrobium oceani]